MKVEGDYTCDICGESFETNVEIAGHMRAHQVSIPAETIIVGRYCGVDTSGSAFYLAAWESDDPEVVRDRLDRISSTAEELIDVLENGA